MTSTISLISIRDVRAYLEAIASTDLHKLRANVAQAAAKLVDAQANIAAVQATYNAEWATYEELLAPVKEPYLAAKKEYEKYSPRCQEPSFQEQTFGSFYHNAAKTAAWNKYQECWEAYRAIREPSTSQRESACAAETSAAQVKSYAERALNEAEQKLAAAREKMDNELRGWPPGVLAELAEFEVAGVKTDPEPTFDTRGEMGAYIRNEIESRCPCDGGYLYHTWASRTEDQLSVQILLDDDVRHGVCRARQQFDHRWLSNAIPAKHAGIRLHDLDTWVRSPVPEGTQRHIIEQLPVDESKVNGWLMVGPPGTSKTTYAGAVINDWLTVRATRYGEYPDAFDVRRDPALPHKRLNYWRVSVPQWLQDVQAWETRDFADRTAVQPSITAAAIQRWTNETGLRPILWLEELDKFRPTVSRLQDLYSLVNVVYEANGIIVSTANESFLALEKRLDGAIYRRLSGENDPEGEYLVWDFFEACKNPTKKRP